MPTINGTSGDDTLEGTDAPDTISGLDGNDTLVGITYVLGGLPYYQDNDTIDGGNGIDTVSYAQAPVEVFVDLSDTNPQDTNGGGTDTLVSIENVIGSPFGDFIQGGAGPNVLHGGDGDDVQQGLGGNDSLFGDNGDDVLRGGAGDDTIDGGAGSDLASYLTGSSSAVTVSLALAGAQNTGGAGVDTLINIENLSGSQFDDALTGNASDNRLSGQGGNDVLNGGGGNDTLLGGARDDTLTGGAGSDTASYADAQFPGVTVSLAIAVAQDTGGMGIDTLTGIENLTGTFGNDTLTGDANANVLNGADGNDMLTGGDGNDTLDGGVGQDQMWGGNGDDTYVVDDANDVAYEESTNVGTDTVLASASYSLDLYVENLTLTGGAVTGTGNDADNQITGSVFANTLVGNGGADTLNGGDGDDLLQGGTGADQLHGGLDGDTLQGGQGNDQLEGGAGADTFKYQLGDGADTVLDFTAEDSVLINGYTELQSIAQQGADVLVTLSGTDQITFSNTTVAAVQAAIEFQGGTVLVGTEGPDTLNGTEFDDSLSGLGGDDTINGLGGNDTIDGGDGIDTINGGDGNDIIDGGAGRDFIHAGPGDDVIHTGSGDPFGTFPEFIFDEAGNDTVYGGAEAQAFSGSAGDDYYDGGTGGLDLDSIDYSGATASVVVDMTQVTGQVHSDPFIGDAGIGTDTLVNIEAIAGSAFDDFMVAGDTGITFSGGDGNDELEGGAGNDVLKGGAGGDVLGGGNGIDTADYAGSGSGVTVSLLLQGEGPQDTGGGGFDSLFDIENLSGTNFADVLIGDDGANELNGVQGDDVLIGGGGDDVLGGASGNVYYLGGDGNDSIFTDSGSAETVEFHAGDDQDKVYDVDSTDVVKIYDYSSAQSVTQVGNDVVVVFSGTDQITFRQATVATVQSVLHFMQPTAGDDTITGGPGDDNLSGAAGNDTLSGLGGDDTLTGGAGNDTLDGGDGTDVAIYAGDGAVTVDLTIGGAQDTGGAGTDTLIGVEGITGSEFNDTLTGDGGSNILIGLGGNDIIHAGDGSYEVLLGGDGNDLLDGGEGTAYFDGGAGDDQLILSSSIDPFVPNNIAAGGSGADTISGSDGWDEIYSDQGYGPDESYSSFDPYFPDFYQQPILDRGSEIDTIVAGNGDDFVSIGYGDSADGGTESGGSVGDRLFISLAASPTGITANFSDSTLSFGGGTITGFESVTYVEGSAFADVISFNAGYSSTLTNEISGLGGDDTITAGYTTSNIWGGDGNDTLDGTASQYLQYMDGGAGNDSLTGHGFMVGGAGNDILVNGAASDTLEGGTGRDTASYANAASGVTVSLAVTSGQDTGSGGFDILSGIENLTGSASSDTLNGDANNNVIDGGAGSDTMAGGAGNDIYVVNSASDTVFEAAGEGVDTVQANATFTLRTNVENLVLTGSAAINGIGNVLDNQITGNGAANALSGGAGADTIVAAGANDVLNGGSGNDTLNGGAGVDTASYIGSTAVTVSLALAGAQNTGGSGTDTLIAIENLIGSSFADTLTGNALNNVLTGGAGADTLKGGAGNDIYGVDNAGDAIVEKPGEGIDLVNASVTWALGANLENLTLTGSSAINGIGNALDNLITGNGAENTLNGGAGADTMRGGAGNDTYIVDSYSDKAIENPGEGSDTVRAGDNFKLGANIEKLVLTGSLDIYGYGNELANVLTGNDGINKLFGLDGNDSIDGGAGADRMFGGTGNDTYYVDNYSDHVVENAGEGTDSVFASTNYKLSDNIEKLTLTGSADLWAYGSSGDNVLTGNSGANKLYGLDAADTLNGGGGNDLLQGGAGQDRLLGGAGNDGFVFDDGDFAGLTASTCDQIKDFATGDRIRLNLVDADTLTAGDQAFAFVGTAAFSNIAGELRYEQVNGNTYVTGDTNGDGTADFMIRLDGLHTLSASDLVL